MWGRRCVCSILTLGTHLIELEWIAIQIEATDYISPGNLNQAAGKSVSTLTNAICHPYLDVLCAVMVSALFFLISNFCHHCSICLYKKGKK